jgi:glucose/arabinose dehydrogenase
MRLATALIVLVLTAAACGGGASPERSPGSTTAQLANSPSASSRATPARLDSAHLEATKIANLDEPLGMAVAAGDDALYVAQKSGRIMAIRDGRVDPQPVLDLSSEISHGGEQGLLGLAFDPGGGFLYVNFTNRDGNTNVVEFAWGDGHVVGGSRRLVLFVQQPFSNHNGGNLAFGPDGYLYIGLGDGGSAGDPMGNAQNLGSLLGKMLRIDPRPGGGGSYGIPGDNPFVGRAGARPEIWAYGLRNPWRYSFDRDTGDLWIGDVGQSAFEEVDHQFSGHGGLNYGWNAFEGAHRYTGPDVKNTTMPIFEYSRTPGTCAVTGGYVYRGQAIPGLSGVYLYADFCIGQVTGLAVEGGKVVKKKVLGPTVTNLSSFGQDVNGELYALSLSGGVYRLVSA